MCGFFPLVDAQMVRLAGYFQKSHADLRAEDQRVLSEIIFINRDGLRLRGAPTIRTGKDT